MAMPHFLNSTRAHPSVRAERLAPAESLVRTGEYSILGLVHTSDEAAVREQRIVFMLVLFGVATIIALLYALEQYSYNRLVGAPVSLARLLPVELTFTYAWALLTPVVMSVARRFPVWGHRRTTNWFVQFAAMIGFVILHVSIFSLADAALDPVLTIRSLPALFSQYVLSWTVLDSIVFCTLVAIHNAVVYYRVSKDRALRASQLETRLAQAQLQMLRMQLQPHFLFNTLHSISALMHKDVRRADSMIAALSDLLRMSLQNIGAQEVSLQSELDFLQRYVEIMSLRFGDRLRVTIDVDPEVRDARVPNLLLQPIVENSFRHGFGDLGRGAVTVTVKRDGDTLRCEVHDDGRGLRTGHKEGIGLASTRQRLAQLYGDRQSFSLAGGPGAGVHVSMTIPFSPFDRVAAD